MRFVPDKDIPAINLPELAVVMRPTLGRIIRLTTKAHAAPLHHFVLSERTVYLHYTVTPQHTM